MAKYRAYVGLDDRKDTIVAEEAICSTPHTRRLPPEGAEGPPEESPGTSAAMRSAPTPENTRYDSRRRGHKTVIDELRPTGLEWRSRTRLGVSNRPPRAPVIAYSGVRRKVALLLSLAQQAVGLESPVVIAT